jgi:hypothetical protein
MKTSNFALRLQHTLMEEARALAKAEGVALNQLINVAVAEKLAVTRTLEFFQRYTRDADVARAKEILNNTGTGNPPMPGDELPRAGKLRETTGKSKPRATRSK